VVAPTHDDPFLAASSPVVGGPLGRHALPHPWWRPVRVVLALATLAGAVMVLHTAPCRGGAWWNGESYANLCYSDVPLSYAAEGHAEGLAPYADTGGRYPPTDDTAPVAALTWASAAITRAVSGSGDQAGARSQLPVTRLGAQTSVQQEAATFAGVHDLLAVAALLLVSGLLVGLSGRRPFDAAAFAVSPVLVMTATIGWDLLGVALAAGALYAWSRRRAALCAVLLGTAVAAAVWPVLLAVAAAPLAWRAGRTRQAGRVLGGALVVWLLWQAPVLLAAPATWGSTVNSTLQGQVGYGSLWRLLVLAGQVPDPALVVSVTAAVVAAVAAAVVALALRARRPPRLPQLILLLLLGTLAVWPTYSPQHVLWLLPFAVLARPRWRDLLAWQAAELLYFCAIWWTLSGASVDSGSLDKPYVCAVVLRVAAQLWLGWGVVRDVLQPSRDPVRADLVSDDPAGGVLAEPVSAARPRRMSWS
jgi:hypothetical protein